MASIQKRDNGRWRARYRDDAGKEHARHFDRKVDAQAWLDDVTAARRTGRYVDPRAGRITFATWWDQWVTLQVWADGTFEAAQQAAASVTFAAVPLAQLRASHVQAWVKAMEQPAASRRAGLAPTTIRTRVTYVRMALRAAVDDRIIPDDPSARVPLPRVRRAEARMTVPTVDQVGAALSLAPDWFAPFIGVCAFAGLRLGEAAGLQLRDVDFLRRTITIARQVQGRTAGTTKIVPPKHGSERVVFVPEELTGMLSAYLSEYGTHGDEAWLFGAGSGDLWNRNAAGHQWRKVRDAAGLEEFTLHDLRHFYASGLIADGCDVVTVQRALGHASATITLSTYAHLWPTAEDRTRSAAAGLMAAALESSRTRGDARHQA